MFCILCLEPDHCEILHFMKNYPKLNVLNFIMTRVCMSVSGFVSKGCGSEKALSKGSQHVSIQPRKCRLHSTFETVIGQPLGLHVTYHLAENPEARVSVPCAAY